MNRITACTTLCLAVAAAPSFAGATSLATGATVRIVPINDVDATLSRDGAAAKIRFNKTGDVRRMLALESKPGATMAAPKALVMQYSLQLQAGPAPKAAVVVYERGGGAWFKVQNRPIQAGKGSEVCTVRVPVSGLKQAAFSNDASGKLEWSNVEKVWIGLIMDKPTRGVFRFLNATLTDEPYKPTRPLIITDGQNPGKWSVGQDKAAKSTLTTPAEGPNGEKCMKVVFSFPGGRHMYMVPGVPVGDVDVEGYRALKFTYKADIPEGLKGLLVTLIESSGGQYYADPLPPASAEWTTIEIPVAKLKKASWSRDPNNQLDMADVTKVNIGTHGTAKPNLAKGTIWVADIQFVP